MGSFKPIYLYQTTISQWTFICYWRLPRISRMILKLLIDLCIWIDTFISSFCDNRNLSDLLKPTDDSITDSSLMPLACLHCSGLWCRWPLPHHPRHIHLECNKCLLQWLRHDMWFNLDWAMCVFSKQMMSLNYNINQGRFGLRGLLTFPKIDFWAFWCQQI